MTHYATFETIDGSVCVGTSTGNVTYNLVLQTTVDDRVRGRVFASYDIVWQTARLVSIGLGGWLVDSAGIRAVYLAGGLLLLLASTIGLIAGAPPTMTQGENWLGNRRH